MPCSAIGRSENLGGGARRSNMVGIIYPLVEIGLIDLPNIPVGNLRSMLLLNLTSIGFMNFFRCFIFEFFFFTNSDVVTIKDKTSK
jgi:hypothetical protein